MRTFISIDLPFSIKKKISQIQENLKKCDLAFKWVKSDNIHLTLKFLGEVEAEKLEQIKKILTKTSRSFKTFQVNLESFGFFPNAKKPRVFFISTNHQELLKSIADKLEEELTILGFEKEGRFKSHITLARIKDKQNLKCLKKELENIKLEEKFAVEEIILYKSTLTPEGAFHEVIFKSRFPA